MPDRVESLKSLAASVVERSLSAGATAAEVYARQGLESEIAVRNGAVETLTEGGPKSVGIRLWRDDRSASTFATDFSPAAIDRLIQETLELATLTDPVPEAALADISRMETHPPTLDLYDSGARAVSAADKLERVREVEAAALNADPRVTTSGGAAYGDTMMSHALANSHGFCHGYQESFISYSVEVIADDADGKKRNGWWYTLGRFLDQLASPADVGRVAAERAVRQIGAQAVPTRRLPVVFDPMAGADLVGLLFSVLRGGAIERRSSYLVGKLNETIGSANLTLVDDPLLPRAPGSRPFDGEGLPVGRTVFVDQGRLLSYALNSFNARKLGMTPTGHASRPSSGSPGETSSNLYLAAGSHSPQSLIADIEYGFYCDGMMGFGFNPATGDFSRGASGRLIENGQLTRPVSEVTISCNFLDLFARLDAVASDLKHDRSTTSPTFRISEMTLAGT